MTALLHFIGARPSVKIVKMWAAFIQSLLVMQYLIPSTSFLFLGIKKFIFCGVSHFRLMIIIGIIFAYWFTVGLV